MKLCLIITSVILLLLYIKEHSSLAKIKKEYEYINKRLYEIADNDENNYILIPSDILIVKETSVAMNKLLEKFYIQQVEYNRSQKSVLQIFTNISHDLRTPVTVLKGYIEMLYLQSRKEELSDTMKTIIEKMSANSNELVHSINNLFNIAKIQSGDMKLDIKKTNLTLLCHDIVLEFYDYLDNQDFNVVIDIEDKPLYANVDTEALQRILKNLIDNAIKYGNYGKYLGLSLYKNQNEIYIDIEDHGKGISEDEQKHIFTRAYTIDRIKGNGLGLAISQELAHSMGGSITVKSTPYTITIFTIKLKS
ncbi:sensor histidine kinase [Clostridioides difficile]